MRLRVLGPMEVRHGESWLPVRALKQRTLLATLLLGAGSPVSIDRLIEQLWPDAGPADPTNQTHLLVSRVRRLFGADGRHVIRTVEPGYVLALGPDDTDVGRFGNLSEQGSLALANSEPANALTSLTEALELWRGPAYADVLSCPAVAAEAGRLEQARLATLEARLDAELGLGRHAAVTSELAALVDEHPFRERLTALLMLALYRSGRQAAALEAYQRTYRRLDEELGVQPGAELRDLQLRMLRADPTLALGADPATVRPAQLPTDRSSMTGRRAELDQLLGLADQVGRSPGVVVIGAIDGMPGIGKTALAVHAAHRLAGDFPDGQLFLDLHGFTRGLAPLAPATALDRLLRSIGVPGTEIPDDVEARAALWRSRTAGKRLVLLLDNAGSDDQVRPLLPASECLVLVTSRHRLGDLDDAVPVSLEVLAAEDAEALFRTVAGQRRLDGEPAELVADVVELCGRLPLAIQLLAGRVRKRPGWRLADLLDRMRDDRARVAELDSGRRSVAGAFRLSYEPLDKEQRRVFRLLGLHPGADFDARAAAALADLDVGTVERILEDLVDVNLLQSPSYARYGFHDLLRAYATETTHQEDSEPDRAAATDRLLGYYAHTLSKAMDVYAPARKHLRPRVPAVPFSVPDFDVESQALAWLDIERTNLVAVAAHAVDTGRSTQACWLSRLLSRYLRNGAYNSDAKALYEQHLRAARAERNRSEEARALWLLGGLSFYTTNRAQTLDFYRRALAYLPEEDSASRASLLSDLSAALRARSCFAEARDQLRVAVGLYREIGDRLGEAKALCGLCQVAHILGEFEAALEHGWRAVTLARESGDRSVEAYSHQSLGFTYAAMANHESALDHLSTALRLYRADSCRPSESLVLAQMCEALGGLGRHSESLEHGERSLSIAQEIRYLNGEYEAVQAIGETLLACGRTSEAVNLLNRALVLAGRLEQPRDLARAHNALSAARHGLGERDSAREHRRQAAQIYARLGVPEARHR